MQLCLCRVGSFFRMPQPPRQFDSSHCNPHIIKAIVDDCRVILGILKTEISSESDKSVTGFSEVESDFNLLVLSDAASLHNG